jgi:hypothetical protein
MPHLETTRRAEDRHQAREKCEGGTERATYTGERKTDVHERAYQV